MYMHMGNKEEETRLFLQLFFVRWFFFCVDRKECPSLVSKLQCGCIRPQGSAHRILPVMLLLGLPQSSRCYTRRYVSLR